ncbi:MAG: bL17 family ribosomal protein, partial [Candidatus Omnitrophica bacterium]|nr:bL17 family ribosomal protein [Candidatus Omnitrophota bacterium]
KLVSYLFKDIGPLFKNRPSGFSRIIRYGNRRGDNAKLVILELTEIKEKPKRYKKEKEKIQKKPQPKEVLTEEKPPITKKPTKKFLGGIRGIFKKERDAL